MRRSLLTLLLALSAAPGAAQGHAGHHGHPAPADAELDLQLGAVRRATERYLDHRAAEEDGFVRFAGEGPLMGEHWYHPDRVRDPLDLERPSTLQYATVAGERVLVGVAYTLYRRPDEPIPEGFAGSSDHWHAHDVVALARTLTSDRPFLRWVVDRRADRGKLGAGEGRTALTMVHAWLWSDNPDGTFAEEHRALPYLRAGLPAAYADGASREAALGVSLLPAGSCEAEGGRADRVLRLGKGQERAVREACEEAAAEVRAALAVGSGAAALNEAAERAWLRFAAAQARALTPEQRARLAALDAATMHPVSP